MEDAEQREGREGVDCGIEILEKLLVPEAWGEKEAAFFSVRRDRAGDNRAARWEQCRGRVEGDRGGREDKAGYNDVAFNYPPLSPDSLTGQLVSS